MIRSPVQLASRLIATKRTMSSPSCSRKQILLSNQRRDTLMKSTSYQPTSIENTVTTLTLRGFWRRSTEPPVLSGHIHVGGTRKLTPASPLNRILPQNFGIMPLHHHLGATHFAAIRIYSSSKGPNPPRGGRLTSSLGMLGAGGMLILGKGKYLLGALKLTKFASLGSMLLTVGAYTAFFGFPYAVGMTGLILIHESGHALMMKRLGIPFSPMVFIPFMGAAVAMRKRPKDAYEEALVAFGGPVLGSVGALGFAGVAHSMDSNLLFALADFGFMINLFNLIPLGSMDGGRICGAISPYAGVVGLGLGGTMAYQGLISNPIFYLILLGGGYETFMRLYDPLGHAPPNYYRITSGQRAAITGGYFGLVGALFAAMAWNRQYMMTPEQMQRQSFEATHYRRYD